MNEPPIARGGLETLSKVAALASVALLLVLRVMLHPAATPGLRMLVPLALIGGWLAAHAWSSAPAALVALATVVPALLAAGFGTTDPVIHTAWLAAIAGCLLPSLSWTRWDLPALWRVLLGGWALTLALAWPVLVLREAGFDPARFGDTVNAVSWAGLSAPLAAGWIMHMVLVQLVALLWLERMVPRARDGRLAVAPEVHGLWLGATAASLVALYQGAADLEFLSTAEWAALGRATGTMLDANTFGMVAALAAPVAVAALRAEMLPRWPALAAVVFAMNGAGVWVSGSRTAFLCGLVGACALATSFVPHPRRHAGLLWPAVGAVVVVVVAAVVFSTADNPLGRELGNPNDDTVAEALFNRGGYGAIANEMVREFPLTGVGAGTYHWLAPDYQRVMLNQELPFDNAQNWWRHQLAELGLLGGLPVLLWSLLVAWMVLRGVGAEASRSTGVWRGGLIGLGVVSLIGMPTQSPLVLLWFFTLVALLVADAPLPERTAGTSKRPAWVAVAALAGAYAAGHGMLAVTDLSVEARALRAGRDHAVGLFAPEPSPDGGEFRWTAEHAELLLAPRTRWLVLRTWVAHPDVGEQPVGLRLATPCQVLFDEELRDSTPVHLALAWPGDPAVLRLAIDVSRTWVPSGTEGSDPRTLGAGLVTAFVGSAEETVGALRTVTLEQCGASGAD